MENRKEDDCISQQELNTASQTKPALFFAFPSIIWVHMRRVCFGFVSFCWWWFGALFFLKSFWCYLLLDHQGFPDHGWATLARCTRFCFLLQTLKLVLYRTILYYSSAFWNASMSTAKPKCLFSCSKWNFNSQVHLIPMEKALKKKKKISQH